MMGDGLDHEGECSASRLPASRQGIQHTFDEEHPPEDEERWASRPEARYALCFSKQQASVAGLIDLPFSIVYISESICVLFCDSERFST